MTALQIIIQEAKSLRSKYPNRYNKWTDYVKQASAIYASQHKKPIKKKVTSKKLDGYIKTVRKGGNTDVLYTNQKKATIVKKISKALKAMPGSKKQQSLFAGAKTKIPTEKTILNKIHRVKKDVDDLDEAQHTHMLKDTMHGINDKALSNVNYLFKELNNAKKTYEALKHKKKLDGKFFFQQTLLLKYPGYINSLRKQLTEAKKHIK
jgi:hypothetical protein